MNTVRINRFRISVIGLLAIAFTAGLAFLLKADGEPSRRFWMVLLPVLLGEALVAAMAFRAVGERLVQGARRAAVAFVPIGYLVFASAMVFMSRAIESNRVFGILQIFGLLLAFVVSTLGSMAAEASERDEKTTKASMASRKNWKLDLDSASEVAAEEFPSNAAVAKALAEAAEKARFSPETLDGHEFLDEPVQEAVRCLCEAVRSKNPEVVLTAAKAFQRASSERDRRIMAAR